MKSVRKAAAVLLIVAIIAGAAGCWDYNDPEDLLYINGLAFDRAPNGRIHCTMEYSVANSESTTNTPTYLEIEGDTFYDTIRNTIKISDKQLNWSHVQVVIVSQDIAKHDMDDLLDMLLRLYQIRDSLYLLVSKAATAGEVIKAQSLTGNLNTFDIVGSLKAESQLEKAPNIQLYEFADTVTDERQSAILPAVGLADSNGEKIVEVSGTAVFRGAWLQGFLDELDTRSMMMMDFRDNMYDLPLPVDPGGKFTAASVKFMLDKMDIVPSYANGKVTLNVFIRGNIDVVEISGASTDPEKFGTVTNAITMSTATTIENSMAAMILHSKQMGGCDILGIGNKLRSRQPEAWKQINGQWRDYYYNMDVRVKAGVTLHNTGFDLQPIVKGD